MRLPIQSPAAAFAPRCVRISAPEMGLHVLWEPIGQAVRCRSALTSVLQLAGAVGDVYGSVAHAVVCGAARWIVALHTWIVARPTLATALAVACFAVTVFIRAARRSACNGARRRRRLQAKALARDLAALSDALDGADEAPMLGAAPRPKQPAEELAQRVNAFVEDAKAKGAVEALGVAGEAARKAGAALLEEEKNPGLGAGEDVLGPALERAAVAAGHAGRAGSALWRAVSIGGGVAGKMLVEALESIAAEQSASTARVEVAGGGGGVAAGATAAVAAGYGTEAAIRQAAVRSRELFRSWEEASGGWRAEMDSELQRARLATCMDELALLRISQARVGSLDEAQVRAAMRDAAKELHPDLGGDALESTGMYDLTAAYDKVRSRL